MIRTIGIIVAILLAVAIILVSGCTTPAKTIGTGTQVVDARLDSGYPRLSMDAPVKTVSGWTNEPAGDAVDPNMRLIRARWAARAATTTKLKTLRTIGFSGINREVADCDLDTRVSLGPDGRITITAYSPIRKILVCYRQDLDGTMSDDRGRVIANLNQGEHQCTPRVIICPTPTRTVTIIQKHETTGVFLTIYELALLQ